MSIWLVYDWADIETVHESNEHYMWKYGMWLVCDQTKSVSNCTPKFFDMQRLIGQSGNEEKGMR